MPKERTLPCAGLICQHYQYPPNYDGDGVECHATDPPSVSRRVSAGCYSPKDNPNYLNWVLTKALNIGLGFSDMAQIIKHHKQTNQQDKEKQIQKNL